MTAAAVQVMVNTRTVWIAASCQNRTKLSELPPPSQRENSELYYSRIETLGIYLPVLTICPCSSTCQYIHDNSKNTHYHNTRENVCLCACVYGQTATLPASLTRKEQHHTIHDRTTQTDTKSQTRSTFHFRNPCKPLHY